MAEGLGFGIGAHTYRMPFDHQGLLPESRDPRQGLSDWIKSIKNRDLRYGNGVSRPWDTSGNDPLKIFKWSATRRQMEQKILDAAKVSDDYRKAVSNAKAFERNRMIENASPDEEQDLRARWAIEDELEKAGGALKGYHAKRDNLAAIRKRQYAGREGGGGMQPMMYSRENAMDRKVEEYRLQKEARRRAGK